MQGFKKNKLKQSGVAAHQGRKNAPKAKKYNGFKDKQQKKLTASIDKNIESMMSSKVAQSKQYLKIVKSWSLFN